MPSNWAVSSPAWRLLAPSQHREALRRLIDQAAHLVRVLHERRLSHRDLKAANILVQSPSTSPERQRRDPVAGAPGMCDDSIDQEHLWLIDLVGVGRHRRLSQRRRIQNLARLNASFHGSATVTRTDRLRFLRVYLGWGLFGKQGWKKWWREIGATTRAKVERNAQRGRPLA